MNEDVADGAGPSSSHATPLPDHQSVEAAAAAAQLGLIAAATAHHRTTPAHPITARVTVADRQVLIENIHEPPSLYTLARRWVQNDAELPQHLPQEALVVLPPPAQPAALSPEPPAFPDDSEVYDPDEAVRALKSHWLAVRRFDLQQAAARQARFAERMALLTAPGTLAAASLPFGGQGGSSSGMAGGLGGQLVAPTSLAAVAAAAAGGGHPPHEAGLQQG